MSRTSSSARLESTSSRSRSASGPSGPTFPTSFHFPASEASVKRTGVISFIVMNRGTGGAGPSTTTVDFGNYGTISLPTQALGAGQQVPLQVAIPAGCKDPDCEFTITVDATNAILEADEGNNVLQGVCGG
jgi:subtilase family serine protease